MSAADRPRTKPCEVCRSPFTKPSSKSWAEFEGQRACGRRCSHILHWRARNAARAARSKLAMGKFSFGRKERRRSSGPRETVEQFLARGGAITRIPTPPSPSIGTPVYPKARRGAVAHA